MCGIAGVYVTDTDYDSRISTALPVLALYMRDRGKHSWGVTDGTNVQKFKGDIIDGFANQFTGSKQWLLHTRFATIGDITAENSHPFKIGKMLGVHNGQVYNHKTVAEKYGITYQVDSEVLLNRIEAGADLADVDAYGAVVFFEDGLIHIGKFNGGAMALARTTWGWMWASTQSAVEGALRMSGLEDTGRHWVKLKEGKLYKLIDGNIAKDPRRLNCGEKKTPPTTAYTSSTTGSYSSGHGLWGHGEEDPYWKERRSMAAGRSFCAAKQCYYDPKDGKYYDKYFDTVPIKEDPLPTAQTTTFTSEPSSDDDEVVEVEGDNPNEDPVSEYEESGEPMSCSMCHDDLMNSEYVLIKKDRICSKCYRLWMQGNGDADDDTPVLAGEEGYLFVAMTADEIYDKFHNTLYMQCEECGSFPFDDEKMYVDEKQQISVCEECYQKLYTDGVEEEAEEAIDESAMDGGTMCGPVTVEEGVAALCVRHKGHAGSCIDALGKTITAHLPNRKLIPAA